MKSNLKKDEKITKNSALVKVVSTKRLRVRGLYDELLPIQNC